MTGVETNSGLPRRDVILGVVGAALLGESGAPALGDEPAAANVAIALRLPAVTPSEDAAPVTVEAQVAAGAAAISAIHLLAASATSPEIASFFLTPASERATVSSPLRLTAGQMVHALVETSDGAAYRASAHVDAARRASARVDAG